MAHHLKSTLTSLGISARQSGCAIGAAWQKTAGADRPARSPIDGQTLAAVRWAQPADVDRAIAAAHEAFLHWRLVPAPRRGEFVRRLGQKLRDRKVELATLVSVEAGKITAEALGEVQEMIDICDFAVGLSRQLYGLTIASERPGHRMMEQWHPLGVVGVISAFNFPVAVWAWNAMLALVCGDTIVWKPSEKTPLTAVACHNLLQEVIKESPDLNVPPAVSNVIIGDAVNAGQPLAASHSVPLISATGSTRMGQAVAQVVAARLGRSLLELGGNNAMILTPSADLELATRAIVFAAAGTAGQRCTTLRRLIVHNSIKADMVKRLAAIYANLKVGDPTNPGVLVGPLIDEQAYTAMQTALRLASPLAASIFGGERIDRVSGIEQPVSGFGDRVSGAEGNRVSGFGHRVSGAEEDRVSGLGDRVSGAEEDRASGFGHRVSGEKADKTHILNPTPDTRHPTPDASPTPDTRHPTPDASPTPDSSFYVRPAIVDLKAPADVTKEETFAPILYVMGYDTLEEAIALHNDVPQGLSSAIFTTDVREAELFLSASGSDCGIANVNIGTSGAEIGGAFGGEKSTGGGRESGSDAWKNYMRRTTNTVNYSTQLPLAQGIEFDV